MQEGIQASLCTKGLHLMNEKNTLWSADGSRRCKACRRESAMRRGGSPYGRDVPPGTPLYYSPNIRLETDWMQDGACYNSGITRVFFPDGESWKFNPQIGQAKRLCAACSVRPLCYAWAIIKGEHGIWGGTLESERANARSLILGDLIQMWPTMYAKWVGVTVEEPPHHEVRRGVEAMQQLGLFDDTRAKIRARASDEYDGPEVSQVRRPREVYDQ